MEIGHARVSAQDQHAAFQLDALHAARWAKVFVEQAPSASDRSCSLTEAIETTTAEERLVFHIFASLAKFERATIRERTRAGLDAACARGHTGGRPPDLTAHELTAAAVQLG
jgi:DNA invertase Pin-like site-specific DNA recombinase